MAKRRRGNGEGTIYQRKDGRWTSAISLGYQDGKLKRKQVYGKTRAEVQKKLTRLLNNQEQGMPIVGDRKTVGKFLDQWLLDVAKNRIAPRTFESYSQIIDRHLKPSLGRVKLSKLTPQHVQRLMKEKLDEGLSPRTVQYIRGLLRNALKQAEQWGLVSRNVAKLVDPPKAKRPKVKPLDAEQVQRLLKAAKGDPLEAVFVIAVSMGLRQGEILGLEWNDIDFEKGTIRVKQALQRYDGKLVIGETKTERSRRTLPMPSVVPPLLQARRENQKTRVLAGPKYDLVFTTASGKPVDPTNLLRSYYRIRDKAGLPKSVRFHDLRHSCATLLLSQGVPARTIMEILGHSEIRLTMDTYAHVMPNMLREGAEAMNQVLKRAGASDG